ncbi:hypothetical protein TanjilG_07924 [Lupinus angustifolius]|uniref:F-box domain-containing protein n=1 Tax=Lupinus angustifolius TaxID=3871 RepID=A0A1J7H471_LUPAN|nr:PREDICTED: F-box protein AFR-like [Lupinus angustifolius]OIV96532.1 hypothetical protein TanjilG_07924 [Lupinus angustifolius]
MNDDNNEREPLIPGLPDEVSELCLVHLPYPYHFLLRSVSSSWNSTITNPSFFNIKQSLSLSQSYLLIFAFHKLTSTIQCHALHPSSACCFLLPPPPLAAISSPGFACAALPRQGKLFVMDGNKSNVVYNTAVNKWSPASPMPTAKSLFAAESVNGKIITVDGSKTEIYYPESDTWKIGIGLGDELASLDVVAVNGKVYLTEGWRWPFTFGPRGWVYDCEHDMWQMMKKGMREGWTGIGVTVAGRIFVITEYGDCPIKVYDEDSDTWQYVRGDKFPRDVMKRPYVLRGFEEKIYVVSDGLNVAIGSVVICEDDVVRVRWEVVEAPKVFGELSPSNCQVMYA